MVMRHPALALARPALGALVVWLAAASEGHAQRTRPGGGQSQPPPNQKQVAIQELNGAEAELLREAYIVLAAANQNYQGHRAKAMHQLQEAVKLLDHKVFRGGTPEQRVRTLQQDAVAARAKSIAQHAPGIREPQALSDALLGVSATLLDRLIPVLVQRNQKHVLNHVQNARKEIAAALMIR
jgi:hypothetical protein